MKKKNLVVAVSAALVATAAGSVFAAPVNVSGSLEGKFGYKQKDVVPNTVKGPQGKQGILLNTELGIGDKTKAVIVFEGIDKDEDDAIAMPDSTPAHWDFGVNKAYVQSTGAWWTGGQDITTTIGDFDAVYSPYTSKVEDKEGIKFENMKLGPMALSAFYGLGKDVPATLVDNEDGDDEDTLPDAKPVTVTPAGVVPIVVDGQTFAVPASSLGMDDEYSRTVLTTSHLEPAYHMEHVYGAQLSGKVSGVDMSGDVVRQGDETSLHGKMAISPVKSVTMSADYAVTNRGENDVINNDEWNHAMLLEGKAAVAPALTLRGSYRDFEAKFNPMYRDTETNDDGTPNNIVDQNRDANQNGKANEAGDAEKGFHVGADAKIASVNASVDYDQPEQWVEGKADTALAGFKLNGRVRSNEEFDYLNSTVGVERTMPVMGLQVTTGYTYDHHSTKNTDHTAIDSAWINSPKADDVEYLGAYEYKHTLKASTKTDVLALKGIDLTGQVYKTNTLENIQYGADAKYTAPNGITVGAGYDSYKGASAEAGLKITF